MRFIRREISLSKYLIDHCVLMGFPYIYEIIGKSDVRDHTIKYVTYT